MERGANTFPFHNLLPYSESNEGLFLFFSPSLNWIKEKSVATLAICNICDQKQNNSKVSSPTVLQYQTYSNDYPEIIQTINQLVMHGLRESILRNIPNRRALDGTFWGASALCKAQDRLLECSEE